MHAAPFFICLLVALTLAVTSSAGPEVGEIYKREDGPSSKEYTVTTLGEAPSVELAAVDRGAAPAAVLSGSPSSAPPPSIADQQKRINGRRRRRR